MPARVFISYSRKDERYKNEVVQQLRVLERQGLLSTWSDEQIATGSQWHDELIRELEAATVVVLLVTANFLTSDFILREEVPRALKAHKNLRIVPTLCRPCAWEAIDWLHSSPTSPGRSLDKSALRFSMLHLLPARSHRRWAMLSKARSGNCSQVEKERAILNPP
jgi:TIR domain